MPSGKLKPERPKPTSALLKQSNEKLKMAIQNILPPPNDTPPVNLMSTDGDDVSITVPAEQTIISTSDLDGGQMIASFDVIGTEAITTSNANDTSSVKLQTTNQFVQLKPPTTTARVQSPDVKNFFIRKGVEKIAATHSYVTLRTGELQPNPNAPGSSQTSPNKKIIIKSQQIIKPANATANQQVIQTIPASTIDDSVVGASTDLSDILNLPILFADNEGNLQDHGNTDGNASVEVPQMSSNILIPSDKKLPNRPVVISAANVSKLSTKSPHTTVQTQPNNKLIFINRHQLKSTTSGPKITTTIAKSMPPLKLVTTATPSNTTGTFTKLAPGTKIDLSTLKIVKSGSASNSGNIVFNKTTAGITNQQGRNTFVIKPGSNASGAPSHQVIKTGILNRNITVRKVVNLMPNQKIDNVLSNASTKVLPEKSDS